MNLSVGIVGLPNAGKSTLFNALLKKQVALAANYPFATIEPNVGVVPVPDPRLSTIATIVKTEKIVPATVMFVDIAGLVKGAATGEGLGNKFLSHIREVDLICNVLRTFQDPDVVHVAGEVDSTRDKDIIEAELILADLETLGKQSAPRMNADKEAHKRWELIELLKTELNKGIPARAVLADPLDQQRMFDLHLLTMKPILYVYNVGEQEIATYQKNEGDTVVVSAKIEAELAGLSESEQKEYLASLGLKESGLERLIQKAYTKLNLISFLTGGEKEARAWTLRRGETALRASGVIHTDFMKNFIKAEVITFDEFVRSNGWTKAREEGKVRLEGREYIMQDGDIVDFKINA